MDGVPCLRVSQCQAQQFRKYFQSQGILDLSFCLQKDSDGTVLLPILPSCLSQLDLQTLKNRVASNSLCEIVWSQVPQQSKREKGRTSRNKLVKIIQELLESHGESWTEDLRGDIPHSCQRHGDLALLGDSCFSLPIWKKIGQELWSAVAKGLGAKRLAKMSRISRDGFRSPVVTMLLGQHSWVTHIDNGISYEFDVTKSMFSAGNITEKLRVAAFDCRGETVVDLYAGIGYFTLPYLVHARASHVHACEWNPDAVKALQKNLERNRVSNRCTIHQGDNRQPRARLRRSGMISSVRPRSAHSTTVRATGGGEGTPALSLLDEHMACILGQSAISGFVLDDLGETDPPAQMELGSDEDPGASSQQVEVWGENPEPLPLCDVADRVNLGLIPSSEEGWPAACRLLRRTSGGILHIHQNVTSPLQTTPMNNAALKASAKQADRAVWQSWADDTASCIASLLKDITGGPWRTNIQHTEHVKSYAPHVHHVVLDLECRPL